MQKSSTKTRIETNITKGKTLLCTKSCKSRLRKQGLKHQSSIQPSALRTKLQKSSTKTRIETCLSILCRSCFPKLQKSSTKTRIETLCLNCRYMCFIDIRCKSRLRKQGLKRYNVNFLRSCSVYVAKVVYENKD